MSANDCPGLPPEGLPGGGFSPDTGTEHANGGDKTPAPDAGELTVVQTPAGLEYARNLSAACEEVPPSVPGYQPVRKLGEGTYGHVWLFAEARTGVLVAIKFFPRGTGERWLCMQAEVKQLALLADDPGIVQLKDLDAEASPPYYVMTYAPGGSLAGRLADGGRLPVPEALRLFREVALALAYVHAKGVRHCDLKPGNVLLDVRGRALVADFGQSHLGTDLSPALGTFFYMAPEQADLSHSIPDTRWDVYGLGALFYAMVTGRPPRDDPAMRDELGATAELSHRLRRYREGVGRCPRPTAHHSLPGMDGRLARVIDACLDLDPAKRPRDAGSVLALLDRRERARQQRPLLAVGVLAPLLLLLGMALAFIKARQSAYDDAREAVLGRLERNDVTMAHLVANVLRLELEDAVDEAVKYAGDRRIAAALSGGQEERRGLDAVLKQSDLGHRFFRVTVADADGRMVASASADGQPLASDARGRRWCWREWFNGKQHYLGRADDYFPPLEAPVVSGPYRSAEDGKPLIITVSCPVRDPAGGKTVGVLVGAATVEKLSEWLQGVDLESNRGGVVVLNRKAELLLHPKREKIVPKDRFAEPTSYADTPVFAALVGRRGGGASREHVDPIDLHSYVAGYAPVRIEAAGWGVVVQHDREKGLEPVEALRSGFTVVGLSFLTVVGGLTSLLWAWLVWKLRREEVAAHA